MGKGLDGFQEKGKAGFSLTPGSVLGVRWFWVPSASLGNPFSPGDAPPSPVLFGQTGYAYEAGGLEARCGGDNLVAPRHRVPVPGCGCGFWAYWSAENASGHRGGMYTEALPVLGVVEGYGRVIHGELGFRAQKARVVALCPAFEVKLEFGGAGMGEAEYLGRTWTGRDLADAAVACLAGLETRLGDAYEAKVYSSETAMLAMHPPGRGFLS